MNFREQAIADLATLLNVEEFAETRRLNGVAVACILDDPARPLPGNRGQAAWEGINEHQFELRLRSDDIERPANDQRISIDERSAIVIFTDVTDGLLTLRCRWWES